MSILGSVETFMVSTGWIVYSEELSMRLYAFILLVLLVVINLVGVRFVSKTGMIIIAFVFISILSMLIGLLTSRARNEKI